MDAELIKAVRAGRAKEVEHILDQCIPSGRGTVSAETVHAGLLGAAGRKMAGEAVGLVLLQHPVSSPLLAEPVLVVVSEYASMQLYTRMVHAIFERVSDEGKERMAKAGRAFQAACKTGDEALLDALLAEPLVQHVDFQRLMPPHEWPLHAACAAGHVGIVRRLLALPGVPVNAAPMGRDRPLTEACKGGHLAVVRELLALSGPLAVDVHADSDSAFVEACTQSQTGVVEELLALSGDRRIDICGRRYRALRSALEVGRLAVVGLLLTHPDGRAIGLSQ
ncbi:fem-1, partial [Symbiodinium sp. KB8]